MFVIETEHSLPCSERENPLILTVKKLNFKKGPRLLAYSENMEVPPTILPAEGQLNELLGSRKGACFTCHIREGKLDIGEEIWKEVR